MHRVADNVPEAASSDGPDQVPASMPTVQPVTEPERHQMTPDPWMSEADPWMQWHNEQAQQRSAQPEVIPVSRPSTATGLDIYSSNSWNFPGLGSGLGLGASPQSFAEVLGATAQPPPLPPAMSRATVICSGVRSGFAICVRITVRQALMPSNPQCRCPCSGH